MRPFIAPAATAPRTAAALTFRRPDTGMLQQLAPLLHTAPWRTCDFTAGGLMMWAEMFNYAVCVARDTLFVRGLDEADRRLAAFSVPVGAMPLHKAIELVRRHCDMRGLPCRFTAVPEELVPLMQRLGAVEITELPDWADYLYDIESLATLTGKKYNKKRNHVNRFVADNPGYAFGPLTAENIDAVRRFYEALPLPPDKSEMAAYDRRQVLGVLAHPERWPFEGAVLSVPGRGVVAFTMAEPVGDTLHIHIEKMDHTVAGAGEMTNKSFAEMMLSQHPELRYVNRQDDAGDPGLRHAKESYHPLCLLKKYSVRFA